MIDTPLIIFLIIRILSLTFLGFSGGSRHIKILLLIGKHCVKVSVVRISSLYSVQMRENTNKKNSEYGHFLRSETPIVKAHLKICQISMRSLYLKMVNWY